VVPQINDFDWRTPPSILSPWRYSRTAIELQLALRCLGAGLRDDATREKAEEDLFQFGSSFFGQSLTCEETDLIADMLRGISGVVACKVSGSRWMRNGFSPNIPFKLVNSGMQRITQLFQDLTDFPQSGSQTLLHNTGEALHLMSSILQPLRAEVSGLPTLEPDVQDAFVNAIHLATSRLDEFCTGKRVSDEVTNLVVVVARLWQFDLCLPGAWTQRLREVVADVLTTVVRLAAVRRPVFQIDVIAANAYLQKYSSGVLANSIVFDVLIDTAFLLFDGANRSF
jgi:mediator of RNA polymerase II transcription subunit 12